MKNGLEMMDLNIVQIASENYRNLRNWCVSYEKFYKAFLLADALLDTFCAIGPQNIWLPDDLSMHIKGCLFCDEGLNSVGVSRCINCDWGKNMGGECSRTNEKSQWGKVQDITIRQKELLQTIKDECAFKVLDYVQLLGKSFHRVSSAEKWVESIFAVIDDYEDQQYELCKNNCIGLYELIWSEYDHTYML